MCVVSMIMDHFREKWEPWVPNTAPNPYQPWVPVPLAPANPPDQPWVPVPLAPANPPVPITVPVPWGPFPITPAISKEEIEEFRKLLRRAREYDKRTGQEDCEMEEKKQALKKIAELLGVDISFIDKPEGVPADVRSA